MLTKTKTPKQEFTVVLKPKFSEIINSKSLSDKDKMAKLLEDTISHYNLNNRCRTQKGYKYSPKSLGILTSEGCAIGRMLDEESQEFLDNNMGGNTWGVILNHSNFKIIAPEFMVKHKDFFIALQRLHDVQGNWDGEGLNYQGNSAAEDMRANYLE